MGRKDAHIDDRHRISRILWFLYCIFLAASLVLICRIFYLQFIWQPDTETVNYFQPRKYKSVIEPERGSIMTATESFWPYPPPCTTSTWTAP